MSILKNSLMITGTAAMLLVGTGCSMCKEPIAGDPSCVEATHITDKQVTPDIVTYTAPKIAPCEDVFRPEFRAGKERICVTGTGNSLQEATNDAVQKFIKETKCDYIVAVTRSISMNTHPTWRLFTTTNYTVTLYGMPLYLDKIVKVEKKPEPPKPPKPPIPPITKDEVQKMIDEAAAKIMAIIRDLHKNPPASQQPFGLLRLSDINVQIQAKGATPENVGVAFPVPEKK